MFSPSGVGERWWVGESNICCRVLLDVVRAKTHKVGYYLCKSRRVPQPRGKTTSITTSSELDASAILQDHLDAEAQGANICPVLVRAAANE